MNAYYLSILFGDVGIGRANSEGRVWETMLLFAKPTKEALLCVTDNGVEQDEMKFSKQPPFPVKRELKR